MTQATFSGSHVGTPLPAAHLDDFLGGHQDIPEEVLHSRSRNPLTQGIRHFLFVARIRVHYIPTL
jgi:hypothetical protein